MQLTLALVPYREEEEGERIYGYIDRDPDIITLVVSRIFEDFNFIEGFNQYWLHEFLHLLCPCLTERQVIFSEGMFWRALHLDSPNLGTVNGEWRPIDKEAS